MHGNVTTLSLPAHVSPISPNGFQAVVRPGLAVPSLRWRSAPLRWAAVHLATAALLILTLAGILFAAGGYRVPKSMPAFIAAVTQENDPIAADTGIFRGNAARTGVNPGPGPKGMPEERWRSDLGAGGWWSSPVIADDVAYTSTEDGKLTAVDISSGQQLWQFVTKGQASRQVGPAVDDGTVYAGMVDDVFYALDAATGEVRWRYETGFPTCASPVVVDGVVYGGAGCLSGGVIFALNATSGEELWRVETDGGRVTSLAVVDGTLYLGGAGGLSSWGSSTAILALDAATGVERWRFDTKGGIWSSPAVVDGTVYVGSSAGLFALDAANGEIRWSVDGLGAIWGAPAVADGLVFAASDRKYLYSFDAATGKESWRADILTISSGDADPTVADGVVYVGNDLGDVFAIDAATGAERWHLKLSIQINAAMAVVDGVVYVGYTAGRGGGIIALADPLAS